MTNVSQTRAITLGAIIVNYNYVRYVVDAIESVLAQDPPFDQILVVDDGSTDHSLQVIETYKPRVQVIAKKNGGQLSASLAGIAAATTDYIYVLDADDYTAPGFVAIAKAHLTGNPVKLQFQLVGVDAEKNPLGSTFPTYSTAYGAREMIEDNRVSGFYLSPPTSGNIYRRDVLANLKLHLIDSHEPLDGSPGLALPYLGPVKSLNQALSYYRVHGKNHSRWDQPDSNLLQGEIDWFYRRWNDVRNLLGLEHLPFGQTKPAYVLERELMQAALSSAPGILYAVLAYLRQLLRSHLPAKQKLMLILWALSLLPSIPQWRKKLVFARRSPLNRSAGLKQLINLLTRVQANLSIVMKKAK